MSQTIRRLTAIGLLLVIAGCIYMAIAAREAPRDSWWALWVIYAVVGLFSTIGVFWLLKPNRHRP